MINYSVSCRQKDPNVEVQDFLDKDYWANFAGQGPQDPALSQQTTANMTVFNNSNPFPRGVDFYTIAADADINSDGDITDAEASPLITDIWGVLDASEVGTLMYHLLGNVSSIAVTRHTNFLGLNEWHVITPNVTSTFELNDLVVTHTSSRHPAGSQLLSADDNHSSIKNDLTASRILNIINTDFPYQ